MAASPPPEPAPGQTIIIERRDRPGLFRRLVMPVLTLLLLLMILSSLLGGRAGLPVRLAERYAAGDIVAAKVAIIEVQGALLGSEVEHVLKQVRQARDDNDVLALVVRIDSPGGTVSGADQVWRELSLVTKPIVASMGDIAASGGYYVATPADRIIAEPTTMTGSIGVIIELPQLGELLDRIGVKMETVATGPFKDSGSMFHKELTPDERERWRKLIDHSYDRFVRIVARDRKLTIEQARSLADGRIMTAPEALENGLVDEIGYLDDAIRTAWNLARLESARVIRYARPVSWSDALGSFAASRSPLGIASEQLLGASRSPRIMYLAR